VRLRSSYRLIPPGGKQSELEASLGGEWIQFDPLSTYAQRRRRASYRFRFLGPVVGLTVSAILAATATNAQAGAYVINDCPAAAAGDYTVGPWAAFGALLSPGIFKQTCTTPGDSFGFSSGLSNNETAGEELDPPSSITVQHLTLWWEAPRPIVGEGWSWAQIDINSPGWSRAFQQETPVKADGTDGTGPTELSLPTGTTWLGVEIYCTTSQNCTYNENPLKIYGAQVTLFDSSSPTASVTGGSLAGSVVGLGTQSFTYTAEDGASGVRIVELLVDGHVVAENSYLSECPYENFAACPSSVSGIISWNTDSVSAGTHEVGLRITSAGGNTAIVADHLVTVSSGSTSPASSLAGIAASPMCISNASGQADLTAHWTRTRRAMLVSHYGVNERIAGRLTTPSGQAIPGATIDVCETHSSGGAPTAPLMNVKTGPTGTWSFTLPRSTPSSTLRFVYSGLSGVPPIAATGLTLRVHAGVALAIAPRITSVGRRIYFSGVVHGPIPPGGKQLVLEASSGGEWIQFDTVRTNARGHYHASYRFKLPGPVTYRFRVLSPFESGFPFLSGTSNGVSVHEL
jgi:hypothetical protein